MRLISALPIPLMIAPTAFEFATLQRALVNFQQNGRIKLAMCGVGEQQAAHFCRTLVPGSVSHLFLLGWAGGLAPDLAVGEVVCADKAMRAGQPELPVSTIAIPGFRMGSVLTSPQVLLTMAEKQSAQSSGAIAVEMEAYPFAAWAHTHRIPFTHVRVILDAVAESLPDLGSQVMDVYGRLRLSPFLVQLLKRPGHLKVMWFLFKRTRSINPTLERLALDLVRTI